MRIFLACTASLILLSTSTAAKTYNIFFDGAVIDLSGTIETSALGTFTNATVGAQISNYAITATGNDGHAFTYTPSNSIFGPFGGGPSARPIVKITDTEITVQARAGTISSGTNILVYENRSLPLGSGAVLSNLLFAPGTIRYISGYSPSTPNQQFLENVAGEVVIATVKPGMAPIPLPATGFLLAGALGGFAIARRRRKAVG